MELVNAGIKSKQELSQRLIAGEVFYTEQGHTIHFDAAMLIPFRHGVYPYNQHGLCLHHYEEK